MTTVATLALAIPLFGAAFSLIALRNLLAQRIVSIAASVGLVAVSGYLLFAVDADGAVAVAVGGWEAPFGIALVADRLAVLLLFTAAVALLAVLVYAVSQRSTDEELRGFHSVYQMLATGVALSLLTGDLFTLFVAFEIMLTASYVLLTYRAGGEQTRATISYVVIGLVASALLLTTIALIYAVAGTVNIADLTTRLDAVPAGLRSGLGWMLFLVFGIKAAIFPLFFWLPDSYPVAATPVTALFAGLLTKIGVYAIVRTQTLLFPSDGPVTFMLVIAGLTMVVGVLGAIAQKDIKRILSFHIVSQIGYMIMGLGFFTVAGVAAAIVFIVHQIIVKASLFLVGGLVETSEGTGAIDEVNGVAKRSPLIAALFLLAAFSLAGFPPLSGFVGKLALVQAGFLAERWVVVGVSLFASLLTLFSMSKIWSGVFWGEPAEAPKERPARGMTAATAALVLVTLIVALAGEPLVAYAERAASDLLEPGVYRTLVIGAAP
ncbi:MAG: proton-conducting transporter membrane subunit [Acidimicrobiia bacterium]|nr:proton-conducting transporter membrane subunit [Acidimicrobiia bacterium]